MSASGGLRSPYLLPGSSPDPYPGFAPGPHGDFSPPDPSFLESKVLRLYCECREASQTSNLADPTRSPPPEKELAESASFPGTACGKRGLDKSIMFRNETGGQRSDEGDEQENSDTDADGDDGGRVLAEPLGDAVFAAVSQHRPVAAVGAHVADSRCTLAH